MAATIGLSYISQGAYSSKFGNDSNTEVNYDAYPSNVVKSTIKEGYLKKAPAWIQQLTPTTPMPKRRRSGINH